MPITSIATNTIGTSGQSPAWIYISCTDDVGVITTAGYLNKAAAQGNVFFNGQAALVQYAANEMGTFRVVVSPSAAGTIYSLLAF